MGKTVEESLPRNPQEGARIPPPGPQVNRVVILEMGNGLNFETAPRSIPQPIDDARKG